MEVIRRAYITLRGWEMERGEEGREEGNQRGVDNTVASRDILRAMTTTRPPSLVTCWGASTASLGRAGTTGTGKKWLVREHWSESERRTHARTQNGIMRTTFLIRTSGVDKSFSSLDRSSAPSFLLPFLIRLRKFFLRMFCYRSSKHSNRFSPATIMIYFLDKTTQELSAN